MIDAAAAFAPPLFNPRAEIQTVELASGAQCHVVDDALREPERVVEWAVRHRAAFQAVDFNAYPGIYVLAPDALDAALEAFYVEHMRRRFDARRLLKMHGRLSMVTLQPAELRPYQWLCHSDRAGLDATQSIQATVLYLFGDEALGGTSFYVPARPADEIAALFGDANSLPNAAFSARYGLEPGYMHASNAYFTHVGGIKARWNRLIFYDGSLLHSADIFAPQRLSPDPARGRLTFNGFFVSRRHAG